MELGAKHNHCPCQFSYMQYKHVCMAIIYPRCVAYNVGKRPQGARSLSCIQPRMGAMSYVCMTGCLLLLHARLQEVVRLSALQRDLRDAQQRHRLLMFPKTWAGYQW